MKKSNKGFVMVFVLITASLLLIFGMSLMGLALSEYRIANAYAGIPKSQYLAESGLNQIRYALLYHAGEIDSSITDAVDDINAGSYDTDKLRIAAKVRAANNAFDAALDDVKNSVGSGGKNNVYEDGYFKINKINVTEKVSDVNAYHNEYDPQKERKDVLDGSDINDYHTFVISIEAEGSYRNIIRKGTAELRFHFDSLSEDGITNIESWKIE